MRLIISLITATLLTTSVLAHKPKYGMETLPLIQVRQDFAVIDIYFKYGLHNITIVKVKDSGNLFHYTGVDKDRNLVQGYFHTIRQIEETSFPTWRESKLKGKDRYG